MKKLPVGRSDFKDVIGGDYYYIDKSLFIKELMDNGAQALLIARPRRFGKTLNLSMLRYFFEKTVTDTSHLFRHLNIWQAGAEYRNMQGKYPVIYLTFKDIKESNWASALEKIQATIQMEFLRHDYLRAAKELRPEEQRYFSDIVGLQAKQSECEKSLEYLSHFLARYHGQKVIILIDEYDTPIQAGYIHGYYGEMVGFMRNFLSGGFKDNPFLEKGVLAGILRIAKESIFSGLNNLEVFTLLSHSFADKFGLTDAEIIKMLQDFQMESYYQEVNQWYNGYIFGEIVIYNPWSIINFLNKIKDGCKPYWLHTSDNALVERLLTQGGKELKPELESLIAGASVEKAIEENIVFAEIEKRDDLLWSFLLFAGYLKYIGKRQQNKRWLYQLQIPNLEVEYVYEGLVERWFNEKIELAKLTDLLQAFKTGNIRLFERLFREVVLDIFSYHDFGAEAEKVYHAFTIGLLVWLGEEYQVRSNRESGYGRYDLMVIPEDRARPGYVIEFKKVDAYENETPESAIQKAFEQIRQKKYAAELIALGVQSIKHLAIVFQGKQVWVQEEE